MTNDYFDFDTSDDDTTKSYPDFFFKWDKALDEGRAMPFLDVEELNEIIEIYLHEELEKKARKTIDYALSFYPDDDELRYDILLSLNDYALWNDLLALTTRYENSTDVWVSAHRLTALLHLRMEEDAFNYFRKKKEQLSNQEERTILYLALGEALTEVDLKEASLEVMDEAITLLGENIDFYWVKLSNYRDLNNKEKALEVANKIEMANAMDAASWERLGAIYKELEEYERSIDAYEFALSLGLKTRALLFSLIDAYEKNGNLNMALEKAKEFLEIEPESYLVNMMASHLASQTENWNEAITYMDAAIRLSPESTALYLFKSNCLLKLGEYKKAIKTLEDGIEATKDEEGEIAVELNRLREQGLDS